MRIEKLWVVTIPGPDSTFADILFETNPKGLALQFNGGLEPEEIHAFFTEQAEAAKEAQRLMSAYKKYLAEIKGGKSDGKS